MVTYDAGLITFNFCACEETKVVKAGFFSLFSKVDNKYSHSQEDSNSNIIWQDCANVHARLVFCCSNMRYMYM